MERYTGIISETSSKTLLVVDDDEVNRSILANLFSNKYSTEKIENGRIGLSKILAVPHQYCAVLLDVMMPAVDGLKVLQHLKQAELLDRIPVFLITAETSDSVIKEVYQPGMMDVINRPIVPYVVARRVNSVIELFRARHRLFSQVMHRREKLLERARHVTKLNQGVIEALSTVAGFRSAESGDHARQIYEITKCTLEHTELGIDIDATSIEQIALASIIHGMGKIAIPDVILNKSGKLTSEEFEIMKARTAQGALLLEKVPQLRENDVYRYAYDITRHRHERWGRSSYPNGLKGNEISLQAQIISLADVYDILNYKWVYKDACLHIQVSGMIQSGVYGALNSHLLKCFFSMEGILSKLYRH